MDFPPAHEAFFGFAERPFSLTPDPKYYFRSRSHSRAFDALSAGVAQRESVLLVTGDLGVGKTTLCRTFIDLLQRKTCAALISNALVSPEDLLRLLLQDLGGVSKDEVRTGRFAGASHAELNEMLDAFLSSLVTTGGCVVLIVDEAQSLPAATVEQIVALSTMDANREKSLQIVLAGQPAVGGGPAVPKAIDQLLTTRARLLPLERDECDRYIAHRLAIAGGAGVTFDARAVDVIYTLSGGVARLVNLLCEHGLQQAAAAKSRRIEFGMIESAAAAFELGRLRPKRFRWFGAQAR
ncbi:MAG: AAA family ATPase [Acidobacteriota bacterium]|nr:AAA family ATPase [Acidobacteriota bacterium]